MFQYGEVEQVKGKLVCSPRFTFFSPDRRNYAAYIGVVSGRADGYTRIYKTKPERDKFLSELKWRRRDGGAKFTIEERRTKKGIELVYDGVVLRKTSTNRVW